MSRRLFSHRNTTVKRFENLVCGFCLKPLQLCVTQEVETIVKASVTTPDTGGQIHMVVGITQETPENPPRCLAQEAGPVAAGEFH